MSTLMSGLSNWFMALVPTYGPWLLGLATFLSCLALPVPVSILMLTAGGFVASGDLSGWQITVAALAGRWRAIRSASALAGSAASR